MVSHLRLLIVPSPYYFIHGTEAGRGPAPPYSGVTKAAGGGQLKGIKGWQAEHLKFADDFAGNQLLSKIMRSYESAMKDGTKINEPIKAMFKQLFEKSGAAAKAAEGGTNKDVLKKFNEFMRSDEGLEELLKMGVGKTGRTKGAKPGVVDPGTTLTKLLSKGSKFETDVNKLREAIGEDIIDAIMKGKSFKFSRLPGSTQGMEKVSKLFSVESPAAKTAREAAEAERKTADAKIIEAAIRKAAKKPTGELTKADLEKVPELELDGKQLTDVKSLEKLSQLKHLHLNGSGLTELPKGLEKLTQLKVLWLKDNPDLTKAQIDELQKALPKCTIHHNAKK